jgi:hypothetical protein
LAWIESHQSLGTHRKLMKLMRALRISDARAVGHLHYLWWWALDNSPDGDLSRLAAEDIAAAGHWKNDPPAFLAALVDAGWVDATDGGLSLHDWNEYTGRLIGRRVANKERMRRERAAHVRKTCAARVVPPYPTVPNRTVPITTKETVEEEGRAVAEGVIMSEQQMKMLITRFGDDGARQRIESLSVYKQSTGKKYKSDYHTVLNWERMNARGGNGHWLDGTTGGNHRSLVPRAQYTRPEALRHHPTGPDDGRRAIAPDPSGEQS